MKPITLVLLFFGLIATGTIALAIYLSKKLNSPQDGNSKTTSQTQEFVPFVDIKNDMMVLPGHSYRGFLRCSATNYHLRTSEEQLQIEKTYQRFINSINFPYEMFLQTKTIDNSERLKALEKSCKESTASFKNLNEYAEVYQQEMAKLTETLGNTKEKDRYIVIYYDDAGDLDSLTDEEKMSHAAKVIAQRCSLVSSNLDAVGVNTTRLSTMEIIQLIYSCFHRDNYSYANEIAEGGPFSLFVEGVHDNFKNMPKPELLDLILIETINKMEQSGMDQNPLCKEALAEIKRLQKENAALIEEARNVQ